MFTHLLVVANDARAHLYEVDEWLEEVHPTLTLSADTPGERPADPPPTEGAESRFAQAVCARIRKARENDTFERLILVAPPLFLNALRAGLGEHAADALIASIDQDWTGCSDAETFRRTRAWLTRDEGVYGG